MATHSTPPAWADRLLRWLCPPYLVEELLGDLHEQFAEHVDEVGEQKARQRYVMEVVKFVRPYFLRRQAANLTKQWKSSNDRPGRRSRHNTHSEYPQPFFLHPDMLRNYLKIGFRNLWKSKGYAAINVVGLSVAFVVSVFLFLRAYLHLTFDSFHEDENRIFQTYIFRTIRISPAGRERCHCP